MSIVVYLIINTLLILLIEKWVKGVEVDSVKHAVLAAAVMGILNAIVYPVVVILTLPFTILTLGLFLLVVHALMFKLCAALVPGFRVRGFLPALWGSILLTLLGLVTKLFTD